jgi:hypothetical protein
MNRTMFRTVLALAGLTLSLSAAPLNAQSASPAATAAAPASPTTSAAPAKSSAAVPAKTKPAPVAFVAPPQKGMVWVNTASGAYHTEGMKYYGKTKQGKYMTEADAIKAGYHPAKNTGKS